MPDRLIAVTLWILEGIKAWLSDWLKELNKKEKVKSVEINYFVEALKDNFPSFPLYRGYDTCLSIRRRFGVDHNDLDKIGKRERKGAPLLRKLYWQGHFPIMEPLPFKLTLSPKVNRQEDGTGMNPWDPGILRSRNDEINRRCSFRLIEWGIGGEEEMEREEGRK